MSVFSRMYDYVCPDCGRNNLQPSKLEYGKVVCHDCNQVVKPKKVDDTVSILPFKKRGCVPV